MINGKIIIGVVGKAGSGKGRAMDELRERFGGRLGTRRGCLDKDLFFIKSDEVAARMRCRNGKLYEAMVGEFGTDILRDGEIDTCEVFDRLFDTYDSWKRCGGRFGEIVADEIIDNVKELGSGGGSGSGGVVLIESATLPETKLLKFCDFVIVVKSDDETRAQRLMDRNAEKSYMTPERIKKLEARQREMYAGGVKSPGTTVSDTDYLLNKIMMTVTKSFIMYSPKKGEVKLPDRQRVYYVMNGRAEAPAVNDAGVIRDGIFESRKNAEVLKLINDCLDAVEEFRDDN